MKLLQNRGTRWIILYKKDTEGAGKDQLVKITPKHYVQTMQRTIKRDFSPEQKAEDPMHAMGNFSD
jgi:hypothetical protein